MPKSKRSATRLPSSLLIAVILLAAALLGSLLLLQQAQPAEATNDLSAALETAMRHSGGALPAHASGPHRAPVEPNPTSDPVVHVKFEGVIQNIDNSQTPPVWTIRTAGGDMPVRVTPDTRIDEEHGPAVVGAWVKVKAHLELGNGNVIIVADKIEVKRSPDTCIKVEFHGELTAVTTNTWTVNEYTVVITDTTEVKGTPVVGAIVKVEGCLQADGTVIATEVKVLRAPGEGGEEVEFRGPIMAITDTQTITDEWQVGRWTVLVISGTTQISGDPPDVGDLAEVHGHLNAQRQVVADRIEVKDVGRVRNMHVRIEGYITELPSSGSNPGGTGTWRIQGIPIQVITSTIVVGVPPGVGVWAVADVVVQRTTAAVQQNGVTYVAVRIRTRRSDEPSDALKFQGVLESKNADGTWTVSGWNFTVDQNTELKKNPQVNDWVEVRASYNSTAGTYTALEIEAKKAGGGGEHPNPHGGVKIKGRITAMNADTGEWDVEGIPVQITPLTIIDERDTSIQVGTWVEVKAMGVTMPSQGLRYTALVVEAKDHAELPKGKLKFEGRLESQDSSTLVVAGWSFVVDGQTTTIGNPMVGERVKVTATRNGSTYHADVIEAEGHHD